MARVTVEDCAEVVPSRFELVALAAQRAKNIASGGEITVSRDNDKNAVVALREIADQTINVENLREGVIQNSQERVLLDKFGVEQASDDDHREIEGIAKEASDEIADLQPDLSASAEDDSLLYGGDDIDVED